MKTRSTLIFLFTFAAGMAFGQEAADVHGPVFGNGELPEFLEVYDIDTNGVLDVEERHAMAEARRNHRADHRSRWDTNDNGRVEEPEREAARQALRRAVHERRAERFNDADTSGDGSLDLEEFLAIPAVSRLAEHNPDKPPIIFDRLDVDDDGLVGLEEFLRHLEIRHDGPHPPPRGDREPPEVAPPPAGVLPDLPPDVTPVRPDRPVRPAVE